MKWTPRNTVNLALAVVAAAAIAALTASDLGLDHANAIAVKALATGLLAGLAIPGSPVGRFLDAILPPELPTRVDPNPIDEDEDDEDDDLAPPRTSIPPTRRQGFALLDPLLVVIIVGSTIALLSGVLHGCGASPLRVEASAAHVAGTTLDESCQSAEELRNIEQMDAVHSHETREDAALAVAVVRERWAPLVAGCNAIGVVHDAWVDDLALRSISGDFSLARALIYVRRLLELWSPLAELAVSFGVALPPPPDELAALIEAEAQVGGAE